MSTTTYWSPNQASVAQVETATFSGTPPTGAWAMATLNGKTVKYTLVSGDTAATAATGLYNLLTAQTGIGVEFTEITFANGTSAVITATATTPGTPFANVPGTSAGLVFSTGNGWAAGVVQSHTTANASPSDVNDAQNWLRVNLSSTPPSSTRSLPQSIDDVVVNSSSVPMLWNLDQLAAVQFNTYTRWQSMGAQVGLPDTNAGGYAEWRATRFKFSGPTGSVPAGGLAVVLGYSDGTGSGPSLERYDFGSSPWTLTALGGGVVDVVGYHTLNTFTALNGVQLLVAAQVGTKSNLSSCTVERGAQVVLGSGVVWSAASTLLLIGGSATLNSAPATIDARSGSRVTISTDALTWATVTLIGGSSLTMLAGGTITTLTLATGSNLDKSQDGRALTITNSTIDGDTCQVNDSLNAITFTNATSVREQVTSGPFIFTGTRTVKVV